MLELVIATTNQGKLREIKELLKDFNFKITSLSDYPNAPAVKEDGKTFAQNALKKAATIAFYTGKLTLGEDSGLEVRALKNKPGIHSARFSGDGATDKKNNAKLLRSLRGVPLQKRQARYRCFAALVDGRHYLFDMPTGPAARYPHRPPFVAGVGDAPSRVTHSGMSNGKIIIVNGSCPGLIALRSKGKNGFGYDPLFLLPRYNKTFGELDPAIKAKISHRAKALSKVKIVLNSYIKKIPSK